MLFKKPQKDTDTIVQRLALLRKNRQGKSIFLENDEIETKAVIDFIERCAISHHQYNLAEDILEFAVTYHASTVYLRLKDRSLEEAILAKLKDPAVFLQNWGHTDTHGNREIQKNRGLVEKGFALLVENLVFSEREITIGANETLAARFMHFISDGRCGMEDDKPAWLAFGFAIYQDFKRLPQDIAKAKRKLGLK